MADIARTRRIGEQIQRTVAELLLREINDPRLTMVNITEVEVSRDLSYAKIFLTRVDQAYTMEETLKVIQNASGFIRREIGRRIKLRVVPQLKFLHDPSIDEGSRIDALLNALNHKK